MQRELCRGYDSKLNTEREELSCINVMLDLLHSVCAAAEELAEAAFSHPFRAGQVAVVDFGGAIRLAVGVETEENPHNLSPISAIGVCIEQAHVELEVGLVIGGQRSAARRFIEKVVFGHSVPRCRDVSILVGFVNADFTASEAQGPKTRDRAIVTARRYSGLVLTMDHHHSHALVGVQEDDPATLKSPSDFIARALIHLETVCRFEALQSG
ncbi:hypothetical protein OO17_19090 [Rhodopseudomonas palustris]|uniref:Uncharacterized protein n=1 Tax=Rhodopseudomonas palustris TaxID=1076 RepID=A0A0D7EKB6_RHOPL|nr:hypothetical protein OO17_19090 [Rhodopseudomonas palustris]